MRKHKLKFSTSNTRLGASLRLFTASEDSKRFKDSGVVIDGILDGEALRRGIRAQLEYVVEEVAKNLEAELVGQRERVEAIRIKERERTNNYRKRKTSSSNNTTVEESGEVVS